MEREAFCSTLVNRVSTPLNPRERRTERSRCRSANYNHVNLNILKILCQHPNESSPHFLFVSAFQHGRTNANA